MKKLISLVIALVLCLAIVGCAKEKANFKPGVYQIKSSVTDEKGGYGELSVEVSADGKIAKCEFLTFNQDGTVKDDSYGSGLPEGQRKLAQDAVKANATFAEQFKQYQNVDDVDAVSGATWNYNLFTDCADQFMSQAKQD